MGLAIVIACCCASGTADAANVSHAFERWVLPRKQDALERALLRETQAWGRARGAKLALDPRLTRAADALLTSGTGPGDRAPELETAREAARMQGVTDAQLALVSLRAATNEQLLGALRDELATRLGRLELTHVGVTANERDGERRALVLFSQRLVRLTPIPASVRSGATIRLGGRVSAVGPRVRRVELVIEGARGETNRRTLTLSHGRFDSRIEAGVERGVLRAQLLIDRGRGPESAAIIPIGVDRSPFVPATTPHQASTHEHLSAEEAEAALASLVLGVREQNDLPLPAMSTELGGVARAHAEDMVRAGFFAHVSPTQGDLSRRLHDRGHAFARALENLARGDTVDDLLEAWLASPAHRANLLAPNVASMGVGIALQESAGERALVAVLVLATLVDGDDTRSVVARAEQVVARNRRRAALPALRFEPELARRAAAHARRLAAGPAASPSAPESFANQVLDDLGLSEVALDTLRIDDPSALRTSAHALGPFEQAGVGAAPAAMDGGPRFWVTILYATR